MLKVLGKQALGMFLVGTDSWLMSKLRIDLRAQDSRQRSPAIVAGKDPAINTFANQLVLINKGDEYYYPGENWRAGTIKGDLLQGISKIKRPKAMEQWLENIKTIFGEYSGGKYNGQLMNAIEATYGSKYREALEDMLYRIKTGRNKPTGKDGRVNTLMNWLNGSVGSVMFFKIYFSAFFNVLVRGMILRTIKAIITTKLK